MIGLTNVKLLKSIFNITEGINKFQLCTFPVSKKRFVTYQKFKDEIEKDLDVSDVTATDLQEKITGLILFEEYRKEKSKKNESEKYMNILAGYTSSMFQDFESYLRTLIDLVEDDDRMVLEDYLSTFITYELPPGVYTLEDISEFLTFNNQK